MNRLCVVALLSTVWVDPAPAQSLLDNLRNLRSTVKGLTSSPKPTAPSTASSVSAPAQPQQMKDEADELVPMSALADDPSDTVLEQTSIRAGDPMSFDVLGLKLGMSPREVRRVSKKKKIYKDGYPKLSGDFEFEATVLANTALSKAVKDRSKFYWRGGYAKPSNGAYMNLETILTPQGPQLSLVSYNPPLEGQTPEEFLAALKAKYGSPTVSNAAWKTYIWCSRGAPCDSAFGPKPTLYVQIGKTSADMTLFIGQEGKRAADAALERRAVAIRGATGRKAAF